MQIEGDMLATAVNTYTTIRLAETGYPSTFGQGHLSKKGQYGLWAPIKASVCLEPQP